MLDGQGGEGPRSACSLGGRSVQRHGTPAQQFVSIASSCPAAGSNKPAEAPAHLYFSWLNSVLAAKVAELAASAATMSAPAAPDAFMASISAVVVGHEQTDC